MSSRVPAIVAEALTKSYGRARGVCDIDMCVAAGAVVGLVGTNGAGKTTLMRTILDFIRPTSGTVQIFGLDSVRDSVEVRRRTAYLPGELVLPRGLTGHETLDRYAFARPDHDRGRATDLAARLHLDLGRKVGDLSKGNKQKVGLVLALSAGADLLVLDEPTSGLDPMLQRTFSAIVGELSTNGTTVLLSSHVMSEVEHIATQVALLRDGTLAAFDDISAIRQRARRRGRVRPAEDSTVALAQSLGTLDSISDISVEGDVVSFAHAGPVDPLVKLLAGFTIISMDLAQADLEDAFFSTGEFDGHTS